MKYMVSLSKSPFSFKKYMAKIRIIDSDKNMKVYKVLFGDPEYEDYTKHKDKKRKRLYISRHKKNEDWNISGIKHAGFWSRWILWNKETLVQSASDLEKRYPSISIKIVRRA